MKGRPITVEKRGRIEKMLKAGLGSSLISRRLDVARSLVLRIRVDLGMVQPRWGTLKKKVAITIAGPRNGLEVGSAPVVHTGR